MEHAMKRDYRVWTGLALACGAALGCSQSNAPHGSAPMSVSFMTRPTTAAAASGTVIHAADVTTTDGQNTLTITRAQIVLSQIELRAVGAAACDADDNDDNDVNDQSNGSGHDHGCEALEVAPMLADLPVDSAVVSAFHTDIPAGTYTALEAKLEPARGHDGGAAAFLAANPTFAGVSVRVTGTYNGQAFVYNGAPRAHLEMEFNPPLTVADAGANVTVHADLTQWFRDGAGFLVDPSTANNGGVNATLVANNIQQSFRAFRDDRRDGDNDGPGNGNGNGGPGPGNGDGNGNGGGDNGGGDGDG
jgi:uncharacterized membrane protein YgcG